MKIFKKLPVALITVLFGAVLLSAPALASTSTSALQAQINALMAEIQQLQTQLNQQTNSAPVVGSSTSISACNFTRDLGVGSQGSDVSCLQQYLNAAGFTISNITGYFGLETRDALAKWQAANGIYPSTGFFGNYSREEYAKTVGSLESQNASNQANSSNQSSLITALGLKGGGEGAVGSPVEFVWSISGNPAVSEISDAVITIFNSTGNVAQIENIPQSISVNNSYIFTIPSTFSPGVYGYTLSYTDIVSGVGRVTVSKTVPAVDATGVGALYVVQSSVNGNSSNIPMLPGVPYSAGSTALSSTDASLTIAWNAASGAEYYDVTHEGGPVLVYDNPSTSFTVSNLTPGMPYTVAVRACNNNGCSDWSSYATLTTASRQGSSTSNNQTVSSAPTISAITSPVNVGGVVTITGTNLPPTNDVFIGASTVIGQSSDNDTVLTFALPSAITAGTYSVSVDNQIGTSNSLSLTVNSTVSSSSQTSSSANTSSGSSSQSPATPSAPYSAGSTALSSTDASLTIAWNAVSGAEYYDVTHEGGPVLVYDNPSTSFTVSNLTPGMPYTVAVRACNNNGCSDWSSYATLTTASWTTTSANYYYYSTTSASCKETSDQYTSVSACETALQQHLPNQTTGICYTTLSSCQQSGGLSASILQSSQSELNGIAATLESMLGSLR